MTEQTLVAHGTTILGVKRGPLVALGGDGQITLGSVVMKANANKIRKVHQDQVITGIAGATADALTLREKFAQKLDEFNGNVLRSAVELAKDWRQDRVLRRLEAMMIVASKDALLVIGGNGDVIEPDDGVAGIGSGGAYALAAARAILEVADLPPKAIVEKSLRIASQLCIYTNDRFTIEEL